MEPPPEAGAEINVKTENGGERVGRNMTVVKACLVSDLIWGNVT